MNVLGLHRDHLTRKALVAPVRGEQVHGVARPCFYLVRPDGYIGFRGTITDAPALDAYCQRLVLADDAAVAAPA